MTNIPPKQLLISRLELLLGLLALASVAALFVPADWLTRDYNLPITALKADIYSDQAIGGQSDVEWTNQEARAWQCTLKPGFADPFCSFLIHLVDKEGNGLDLSKYTNMAVHIKYTGPPKGLRIYLRNRSPNYYVLGNLNTTKYNTVELTNAELNKTTRFKLADFGVADWWLASHSVPVEFSQPEFNDVVLFEIQTGTSLKDGTYNIELTEVSWSGPIVSQELLYRAIVILWAAVVFSLLIYRQVRLNIQLKQKAQQQEELININKLLNLQTQKFEELAKTDMLTGVANRLGVREYLFEGLNNWRNNQSPFSLILIDIDHFKQFNDTHGHDVGDKVLKSAAEIFRNSVRNTDLVARWGGEEFIVICPNTDTHQATTVAENLRARLASAEIFNGLKVTASFGVASMNTPSLEHLFKQADEALYSAKEAGRNRVVVSSTLANLPSL